jgi:hypothetical protein
VDAAKLYIVYAAEQIASASDKRINCNRFSARLMPTEVQ